MKTELKDVLHFYCGCQAKYIGQTPSYLNHEDIYQFVQFEGYYGNENHIYWLNGKSQKIGVSYCDVKPILRPLSDITDKEAETIGYIGKEHFVMFSEINSIGKGLIEDYLYLLKQGFDLFGLIENGFAIDKTTLKH